ncbi:MAG: aminotransferase class I/II-fold pyridoxal phosphate-dependent enzyme, partial [Dokdonella sp.]
SAKRQLNTRPDAPALLATDAVFSMDGDVAPLRELADLCRTQQATFMVDDAHGIGVLGANGAGSLIEADLNEDDVPVLMATLGKALGVTGAFVAGSAHLIDGLTQFARTHVYTTALPPALAAATTKAIELARSEAWRRETLVTLASQFREGAAERGLELIESRTPIQAVLVGDSADALAASAKLEDAGFFVPAIRPPTVPAGKSRLRVSLCALHTQDDVERLLDALRTVLH